MAGWGVEGRAPGEGGGGVNNFNVNVKSRITSAFICTDQQSSRQLLKVSRGEMIVNVLYRW